MDERDQRIIAEVRRQAADPRRALQLLLQFATEQPSAETLARQLGIPPKKPVAKVIPIREGRKGGAA